MQQIGKWWFPDGEQQQRAEIERTGNWQLDRLLQALSLCAKNPNFEFKCAYDIGAHVGIWTKFLAQHFSHVLAFEPVRVHMDCLLANIQGHPNVMIYRHALGLNTAHVYQMEDDRLGAQNTGGTFMALEGGHPHDKVLCRAMDDLEFPWPPDFLKIDVEGWESDVLVGGLETIKEHKPFILFEDKPKFRNRSLVTSTPQDILKDKALDYAEIGHWGADRLWAPKSKL